MKNVDAILCSDLHIRETTPECRLDNWMETQARKYAWLRELQVKYNCPILCGGDIFTHWKPSPFLISWALRNLPDRLIAIPGQHDLPAHNLADIEKSGIQVLADANKIILLTEPYGYSHDGETAIWSYPWGVPLDGIKNPVHPFNAALIHYGVYKDKPHYPGAENTGGAAKSVIKKMPGFDLILSGDNHQTFTERFGKQLLVNPGSFMRTTAAQADFKPSVFLWCAETNEVEQVFVPIESGVISREHIDKVEERDERLEAFISRLDHDIEISISFQDNMRTYLAKNKITPSIVNIIKEAME